MGTNYRETTVFNERARDIIIRPTVPTTPCMPMHFRHDDPFGQQNHMW